MNRDLKSALVERLSLSNLHLWCVCPAVCGPSVSVQGTLAAPASFPGPLFLYERWRNAKQRPARAPASEGLRGCCYCYSLWWGLLLPEINDTPGSMWGLAAKTNSQTNSQAGLVHTEERLQNKPGSEPAARTVTQCRRPTRTDLAFPGSMAPHTPVPVRIPSPVRLSCSVRQRSRHG